MIYCCACQTDLEARLTNGAEIYPHRPDLSDIPFWKCDSCKNHVGCHHKTKDKTRPLGVIPDKNMMVARRHIHNVLDPIWQSKRLKRKSVYAQLSRKLGREYHTGELRTLDEARMIYKEIVAIARSAA